MRLFRADPAAPHHTRNPSALTSFVDEVYATLSRLFAYVAVLALFAVLGTYLWQQLPDATAAAAPAAAGWSAAGRQVPAFAVSRPDLRDKTETYEILRHPEGGRKDIFRWVDADGAAAELEIYRPGGEAVGPAISEIAGRLDPSGVRELEAAGIVESKFGSVTLLRPARQDGSRTCLGFLKQADAPELRISGWTCQGTSLPTQRAAVVCMLNRLTLLAAGNDPRLAALFAHAELKRTDCVTSGAPGPSADWVMGSENPRLRGAL